MEENKKNKVILTIVLVIFIAGGITSLVFGIMNINERKQKEKYFHSETGIISDVLVKKTSTKKGTTNKTSTTYAGVYTYMVNNVEYTLQDSVYTSTVPSVGGKVEIFYNPDNPEDAFVKGRVYMGNILILIGILFTIVPFVFFVSGSDFLSKRVKDYLTSFLMSIVFMTMGFGILFLLKPGVSAAGMFLGIFGLLGVYMFVYPFIDMIRKRGSGSE